MKFFSKLILLLFTSILFMSRGFSQDYQLETVIKKGHAGAVKSAAFSPDGKFIATAGRDKTAKIWEISTGREIRTFTGHNGRLICVSFSPDGTMLATGAADSKVKLWETATGKLIRTFDCFSDFVYDLAFTSDGKYIVAGSSESKIKIIETSTGNVVREYESDAYQGIKIKISPDNKFVLTGEDNRKSIITDFETAKKMKEYRGSTSICGGCGVCVDYSSDGKYILSGNENGPLQLIDINSDKVLKVYIENQEKFSSVDISPDGTLILASDENNVEIFDRISGKSVLKIKAHEKEINFAGFSPDGASFMTASNDGTAVIRKTKTGKIVQTFVGFQNTNDYGTNLDKEEYWQFYSRHYFDLKTLIKLSPDGKKLVCGKKDSAAQVFDFETGRLLFNLTGHKQAVICFDFSPDGKLLADGSADKAIFIRNAETGEIINRLKGHKEMIFSVDFSNDGKYLISAAWDGDVIFWDIASGKEIGMIRDAQAFQAKFLPGGIYAATGGLDKKFVLTETDSRKLFREFVGSTDVVSDFDFSQDGLKMISGSWDGKARLWDVPTGYQLLKLEGHSAGINAVMFSTEGKALFTGSADGTVKMWDAATGKELKTFFGTGAAITSIQLTSDGQSLVTCNIEGTIQVWNIENGKEIYTLYPLTRKDWFITTPDGFFDASEGAKKMVYFVQGMKSYSPDQFFEKFYRPGLLEQSYKSRGLINQNINMRIELQKSPPPNIIFQIEKDTLFEKNLVLNFEIIDQGGGIDEIKILHNGKRLFFDPKLTRRVKAGKSEKLSFEIEFVPGQNDISISAFSTERIESRPALETAYFESKETYPDCYMITVGINKYENSTLTLNFAREDAKGFCDEYKKNSETLFRKVYNYNLYDKEATKANILAAIDEIALKARPWDVLVFYYAGHGVMLDEKFYFIPSDCVRLFDVAELVKQAVSAPEMQEKFAKIKALKQVLILDACQSGGSVETLGVRGAAKEKAVAQLSRSAGIHVLASAGSEQYATEFKSLGHGLFTYVLLQALDGKADGSPKDGKITVYELKSYLDDQVPEFSKKLKGTAQYPYSFSSGNDFPMTYDVN